VVVRAREVAVMPDTWLSEVVRRREERWCREEEEREEEEREEEEEEEGRRDLRPRRTRMVSKSSARTHPMSAQSATMPIRMKFSVTSRSTSIRNKRAQYGSGDRGRLWVK